MTDLTYLQDSHKKEDTAYIEAIDTDAEQQHIILDQTIFYPQGGGQPSDKGEITSKKATFKVTHVSLKGDRVYHYGIINGTFEKGDQVTLKIDWERRYHHMQSHTAGHILDEAVKETLPEFHGVNGNHGIGSTYYIEFNGFIDATHKDAVQKKVDDIIAADEPITARMVTRKEIEEESIKVPFKLPKNKPLRLLKIGERPPVPDGGTQLKSTGESWPIKLTEFEYQSGRTLIHYRIKKPKAKPTTSKKETEIDLNEFVKQAQFLETEFGEETIDPQTRTTYLGKKGRINQLAKLIPQLPPQDRKPAGKELNRLKTEIETSIQEGLRATTKRSVKIDVTVPGKLPDIGHLHPITQAINEIQSIFESIGFTRVRYPEVDYDHYVFEALNMPAGHPARDEWETFFVDAPKHPQMGEMVLTTHTSNAQVREMERVGEPPIRMLNIAKCYRRQQDVTHTAMFHQFEGLVIDKGITIRHLKGTLDYFAHHFYGPEAKSRIRPFMFKFTEPSFEVDFSCTHCGGEGCRFCKSGWHETGGAGMVHPNVLKAGGINPEKYTGFAFGWGVERVYTLKPGLELDDIRPLYSSNLDFLENF